MKKYCKVIRVIVHTQVSPLPHCPHYLPVHPLGSPSPTPASWSPGKCQPKNTKSLRHRPKMLASLNPRDGMLDIRVL